MPEQLITARNGTLAHCSVDLDLRPAVLHAAIPVSCSPYWQPLLHAAPALAIARSPLDAGQTSVVIDRHDRPIADFRNTEHLPLSTN